VQSTCQLKNIESSDSFANFFRNNEARRHRQAMKLCRHLWIFGLLALNKFNIYLLEWTKVEMSVIVVVVETITSPSLRP